jgi:valyl-tRNA synthetase
MNSFGLHYQGKDRFVVCAEIEKELETCGALKRAYLNKVEPLKDQSSDRTKVIRSMVLENGRFSKAAIKSTLEDGEVKLHPKRFEIHIHWLNNIRD